MYGSTRSLSIALQTASGRTPGSVAMAPNFQRSLPRSLVFGVVSTGLSRTSTKCFKNHYSDPNLANFLNAKFAIKRFIINWCG